VKLYWERDVNETLSSTLEVVLKQIRAPIPQSKILQREYRKSVIFQKYDNYIIISPNNSPKINNSRIA